MHDFFISYQLFWRTLPSVLSIYDPNGAWHFFEKSTILSAYVVEKKYIGGEAKSDIG